MSYVFDINAEARAALATFDIELQERTYDELDHLAAHPELVQPRKPGEAAICDFVFPRPAGHHYVFMTIERYDTARRLVIAAIVSYFKPTDSP